MDKDCLECGSNDGTHYPRCSNEGGGAFGRKLNLSDVGADGYHPPQPEYKSQIAAFRAPALTTWIKQMLSVGLHPPKTPEEAVTTLTRELARLRRELQAVRVLDAWAKKHANTWAIDDIGDGEAICVGAGYLIELNETDYEFKHEGKTAALARIAAADALLKEDPSLGSEV